MGRTRMFRTLLFTAALSGVFFGFAPGMDTPEAEAGWLRRLIQRITGGGPSTPSRAVPELDPSAAGQAAVLVVGGAWLIAERRRKQA